MIGRVGSVVCGVLTAASIAVVAHACGDASSPGAIAGIYRLERFEGAPLPAPMFEVGETVRTMLEGQVLLSRDGTGLIANRTRVVDATSPQGRIESESRAIIWSMRDTTIEITYVCPPDADCIAGPHLWGNLAGDRLTLTPPWSSRSASTYRRAD